MANTLAIQRVRADVGRRGGVASQAKRQAKRQQTLEQTAEQTPQAKLNPPSPSPSPSLISVSVSKKTKISTRQTASHLSAAAEGLFALFWDAYPNKKGKDAARKAWGKRGFSRGQTAAVLATIAEQQTWPEWTQEAGQFIPHPATWLNAGRWQDEPLTLPRSVASERSHACQHEPPCAPGTTAFRCDQRSRLEAGRKASA